MKLRRGDKVLVVTGKERGKVGTIEKVMPEKNRAIVTGLNLVKKHLKRSSKAPQGGIIDIPASIHVSNLMILDPNTNKPARIGFTVKGKERTRVSKISGQAIPETK